MKNDGTSVHVYNLLDCILYLYQIIEKCITRFYLDRLTSHGMSEYKYMEINNKNLSYF